MQQRLVLPPRSIVIEDVFGKAAGVENSKMRTDARPRVRRRLATIVEAGPTEGAGEKRAFRKYLPPGLGRRGVAGMIYVISAEVAFHLVVFVNPAGEELAAHLRAYGWQLRKFCMKRVDVLASVDATLSTAARVVEPHHVDDTRHAA